MPEAMAFPEMTTLTWQADEIWECGITVGKKKVSLANMVAERLTSAGDSVGMTQCRLAEETGIYQGVISDRTGTGKPLPAYATTSGRRDGYGDSDWVCTEAEIAIKEAFIRSVKTSIMRRIVQEQVLRQIQGVEPVYCLRQRHASGLLKKIVIMINRRLHRFWKEKESKAECLCDTRKKWWIGLIQTFPRADIRSSAVLLLIL